MTAPEVGGLLAPDGPHGRAPLHQADWLNSVLSNIHEAG